MPQLKQATKEDCWRGHRMIWRHVPRGGYGFALLIPVTVEERTPKRVRVRIEATGESVAVKLDSLLEGDMRLDPAWALSLPRIEK